MASEAVHGPPTLVVLAAGMGSRYGGLKQLDPVGPAGERIVDYSVHDAARAGFGKVVFVIREEFEDAFRRAVGDGYRHAIAVDYAHQRLDDLPAGFTVPEGRVKPWGTAHAILSAAPAVVGAFAAVNADDFYGADSFRVLAARLAATDFARGDGVRCAMVGFVLRNTLSDRGSVSRGVCRVGGDGCLEHIEEVSDIATREGEIAGLGPDGRPRRLGGDETVSMNMWGFSHTVFSHLREAFAAFLAGGGRGAKSEFYIPTVVNDLAAAGRTRVEVLRSRSSWFGVTYREDRDKVAAAARRLVEDGEYPSPLFPP
jgi:hypothetical protein